MTTTTKLVKYLQVLWWLSKRQLAQPLRALAIEPYSRREMIPNPFFSEKPAQVTKCYSHSVEKETIMSKDVSSVEPTMQVMDDAHASGELISLKAASSRFLKLAGPFSLTRFIGVSSEFIGAILLAKRGPDYLEASGLINIAQNLLLTTCGGALYATGDLVSRNKAKDKRNVGKILNISYIAAILLSLATGSVLVFSEPIYKGLGQPKAAAKIAQQYFRGFAAGVPALLLSVSSQQTAYAIDRPKVVLAINIVRRLVYLSLAYILIEGNLGAPEMGATGYGIAAAVSAWLDQILFTLYFKFNRSLTEEYGFFQESIKESLPFLKDFLVKGSQLGLQTLNSFLSGFTSTIFMGLKGNIPLAAVEVVNQYGNLFNIPILSAAQSSSILVGDMASSNRRSAVRIGNTAIVLSLAIPLIAIPLYLGIPNQLTSLFVHEQEHADAVVSVSKDLFKVAAATVVANTVAKVSSGSLRGLKDYKFSLFANVGSVTTLGLFLSYTLGFLCDLGPVGVMLGLMIGMYISKFFNVGRWHHLAKMPSPVKAPMRLSKSKSSIFSSDSGEQQPLLVSTDDLESQAFMH